MTITYSLGPKPTNSSYPTLIVSPDFCCETMKTRWGDGIHFPDRLYRETLLAAHFVVIDGNYGDAVSEDVPISYCPFCGKPISVEEARAEPNPIRTESFQHPADHPIYGPMAYRGASGTWYPNTPGMGAAQLAAYNGDA